MTENVQWHGSLVTREQRWGAVSSEGIIVWLTGLSGSGKSTIAMEAELQCIVAGRPAVVLDGDNLRHGLNSDLGFGEADRNENIRRVGEVAILMAEVGMVVLVPLVSPYRAARDAVRERCEGASLRFVEIFVDTPLTECERRDPKGLYAKARSGELVGLTGIDAPYEAPIRPELHLRSDGIGLAKQVALVMGLVAAPSAEPAE